MTDNSSLTSFSEVIPDNGGLVLPSPLPASDKKLKRHLWWLGKYHNFHNGLWIATVSALIASILLGLNYVRIFDNPSPLFYIFGWLGVAGCLCGLMIAFNSLMVKTPLPNHAAIEKVKANSKHNLKRIIIFPVLLVFIIISFTLQLRGNIALLGAAAPYLAPFICGLIILTVFFTFIAVNIALNRTLIKRIERRENSAAFTQALFNESYAAIQAKNEKYNAVRTEKRIAAGKLPKTAREYEKERSAVNFCKTGAFIILCAVLFALVAFIRPNTISLKYAEKISAGDNMGYIARMLGEPYDKRDVTDQQGNVTGGTWKWSSNPKAKIIAEKNRQLETLLKQLETADADDTYLFDKITKLTEDVFNLELELAKTPSDYIFISYSNGKATKIDFETNYKYGSTAPKSLARMTYAAAHSGNYYNYGEYVEDNVDENGEGRYEVNVRMYFSDGSASNFVKTFNVDTKNAGEQTLSWTDEYGGHTFKLILK